MKFLILSRIGTVVNLSYITHIQYNADIKKAIIWLADGQTSIEVMESDYDDLARVIDLSQWS